MNPLPSTSSPKSFIIRAIDQMPQRLMREVADFIAFKLLQQAAEVGSEAQAGRLGDADAILRELSVEPETSLNIEALALKQGYQPISPQAWDQLAAGLDIQEPIEQLLAQLRA